MQIAKNRQRRAGRSASPRNASPMQRWTEPLEPRQLLSTSIVSGQTVNGTITRPGEVDVYTFSAAAGNSFEASVGDTNSSEAYLSDLTVYGPNNQVVASSGTYTQDSSARVTYTVPAGAGGTYTIDIEDTQTANTGPYALEMIDVPGSQAADSDGDGGPISNGQTKSGNINRPGDIDGFTFSASAGNTFQLNVGDASSSSSYEPQVLVYAPNGTQIGNSSSLNTNTSVNVSYTVPSGKGGTFYAIVQDALVSGTGAYDIELTGASQTSGGSVSGTVSGGAAGETVYLDANNNSKLDSGELSTTTAANGSYSFSNVPAGAYIIRQILPSGYTQTSPVSGYGLHITVANGGNLTGENFTDTPPATGGSISGTITGGKTGETVYLDANNNSQLDSGELSTTTSSTGAYSFSNVPAGAYIIRQVLPSGYTQTSPASGFGIHITVTSGGNLTNENFTDKSTATGGSISGTVTGGKAGETIYLDANNNSTLDSGELSTTTNASGQYSFSNVPAGAYIIRQILPSGYTQTSPASGYGIHITVTNGGSLTSENFTDTAPAGTASIAGTVFNDANGDGTQDNGETGLSGWTVYIDVNNTGTFESGDPTATTDSSGDYLFSNLGAGAYIVRVERPSGYSQTRPTNNLGQHITVTSGQKATGANFGEEKIG